MELPRHAFLGYARLAYHWDWAGAEREFRRAIDLDPNLVTAHSYYSLYLVATGRTEQGIAEAHRSQELDPRSLITDATGGLVLIHARRYDESIAQCRRALDLDPNFAAAHWYRGMAYMAQGNQNASIEELTSDRDLAFHSHDRFRPEPVTSQRRRLLVQVISRAKHVSRE